MRIIKEYDKWCRYINNMINTHVLLRISSLEFTYTSHAFVVSLISDIYGLTSSYKHYSMFCKDLKTEYQAPKMHRPSWTRIPHEYFKIAHNKNIIPHTWKLANIIPILKPNKDTDKGTSYRLIALLSVIAKTLEKSLLPYITTNIPNTPMQHGYKTQHSTVTALHTLNNTVTKGFYQMPPLREQSLYHSI